MAVIIRGTWNFSREVQVKLICGAVELCDCDSLRKIPYLTTLRVKEDHSKPRGSQASPSSSYEDPFVDFLVAQAVRIHLGSESNRVNSALQVMRPCCSEPLLGKRWRNDKPRDKYSTSSSRSQGKSNHSAGVMNTRTGEATSTHLCHHWRLLHLEHHAEDGGYVLSLVW